MRAWFEAAKLTLFDWFFDKQGYKEAMAKVPQFGRWWRHEPEMMEHLKSVKEGRPLLRATPSAWHTIGSDGVKHAIEGKNDNEDAGTPMPGTRAEAATGDDDGRPPPYQPRATTPYLSRAPARPPSSRTAYAVTEAALFEAYLLRSGIVASPRALYSLPQGWEYSV